MMNDNKKVMPDPNAGGGGEIQEGQPPPVRGLMFDLRVTIHNNQSHDCTNVGCYLKDNRQFC